MRLPVLRGLIRRRLLVNFRADPAVVQRLLPAPFRPKLHAGQAIVGVCLIRLEEIRPSGLPAMLGLASENAAHRMTVLWTDDAHAEREGVYIPRRDTGSWLNRLAGGRIFPGEHHPARFDVRDDGRTIDFSMRSDDGAVRVHLHGRETQQLPASSRFASLEESSRFFEGGSLGYSATRDSARLDGLTLRALRWAVSALEVDQVESSYFADPALFPPGSIEYDHTLIMRDIPHEWHSAENLCCHPAAP
jgi:uncharacterized protein YqjF (DUF2071 family)